jgi:hypothetical protein
VVAVVALALPSTTTAAAVVAAAYSAAAHQFLKARLTLRLWVLAVLVLPTLAIKAQTALTALLLA